MIAKPFFTLQVGEGPLVATAIHDGHALREELQPWIGLSEEQRRREEDPLTGRWTQCADNRIIVHRSRFEVDLNRPRCSAVYTKPEDAWGLAVWRQPLSAAVIQRSLAQYDGFYNMLDSLLSRLVAVHGRVVVFDLHSYNHRRGGPAAAAAAACENPDINVGTGTLDRERWAPVVDALIAQLRTVRLGERQLDVRENVRFRGGAMAAWIHQRYPATVGALAIEVKKIFMNEWTGRHHPASVRVIHHALAAAGVAVIDALQDVGS